MMNVSRGAVGAVAHSALTGLTADDHTQYALLAGRSGGQSLIGGTGLGNSLTLRSTSHATKGKVIFGAAGNTTYDEVNERFGIGITAPLQALHVVGNYRITKPADATKYVEFRTSGSDVDIESTNTNLFVNYANSNSIALGSGFAGTGRIWLAPSSSVDARVGVGVGYGTSPDSRLHVKGGIATSGTPIVFKVEGGAHTTLNASAEANDVLFALNRTVEFNTGALTNQRAFYIRRPTYGFVSASVITNAATLAIENAPAPGTGATITNAWALWVMGGASRFDGSVDVSAQNIITDTSTGTKVATSVSQKLAFHNSTPVVQRASAAQAAVTVSTNSITSGGSSDVFGDWTDLTTYATDAASIRNTSYQMARKILLMETLVNELRAAIVEKGLIKGSA